MTLETLIPSLSNMVLTELQFSNNEDVVHQCITWRQYHDAMVYPAFLDLPTYELVSKTAKAENQLPYQVVAMAKEEMKKRALAAEPELESADTYVNWTKTPIANHDYLDLSGKNQDLIDYKWAFLFGEPYFEYTRPKSRGALVSYWDPNPRRIPRSRVESVEFAKVVCLTEEYPVFVGLLRLDDGSYVFLRHDDREGLSEFISLTSRGEILNVLRPEEAKGFAPIELMSYAA